MSTSPISMDKQYRYRNGEPARILCVDRPNSNHPVVSIGPDGDLYTHSINGECIFPNGYTRLPYDLIEIPKKIRVVGYVAVTNKELEGGLVNNQFTTIVQDPKSYFSKIPQGIAGFVKIDIEGELIKREDLESTSG